jgi:hypothetical protein
LFAASGPDAGGAEQANRAWRAKLTAVPCSSLAGGLTPSRDGRISIRLRLSLQSHVAHRAIIKSIASACPVVIGLKAPQIVVDSGAIRASEATKTSRAVLRGSWGSETALCRADEGKMRYLDQSFVLLWHCWFGLPSKSLHLPKTPETFMFRGKGWAAGVVEPIQSRPICSKIFSKPNI